jgi:protoheme IX farnesyltransferase
VLFKAYYQLTKPGIIYGNLLTALAGYLFASAWHIDWSQLLGMLVGTSLVIASACVCNNYLDRGIDSKMARTKKRALVSGTIPVRSALIYASVLFVVGFAALVWLTNLYVVVIGLSAFVIYVVCYGFAKRHSVHGTLVGSFAGAAPILAGYISYRDRIDAGAIIVFLIMLIWQMPHFYAIAMYRLKDYQAAKLPVLPAKKGLLQTKWQIITYIVDFILVCVALSVFGYAGASFAIVMAIVGLIWLVRGIRGFRTKDEAAWARQMFFFSLIVLLIFSLMLSLGSVLA